MRPAWGDLERPGRAAAVWRRSQHAFHSNVAGPHFEEVCRQRTRWHAQETMFLGHLERLEHIRALLAAKGEPGAGDARLLLFGGAGFSDALRGRAAADPSVQLIGLDRLYHGS
jgi:hypothetical protein